jgi:diguanylate cyclase (GGDEF)-like protein/PAS domain S-box-containing protein
LERAGSRRLCSLFRAFSFELHLPDRYDSVYCLNCSYDGVSSGAPPIGFLPQWSNRLGWDAMMKVGPGSQLPMSLLSNERQYKLLVDAVVDYAIYMLDPDGFIVSWNTGAERLKGYTTKEILGRNFAVFYTLEEQNSGQPKRALQTAASAGRFSCEGWRVRKDGSRFWASVVIDPVYVSERLVGYAKVTRDISERKQSELSLQNALERLLLATESGGIGIWDLDVQSDMLLWDDVMYRLYGLDRSAGANGIGLWRKHLHPDDRAATEQAHADALSGRRPFDTEFRIVWNDGSIHHLRASARVTRDETGQALHMIGSNWDITALKQAERKRDEAQAKITGILENMRGYIFERAMSPDGRIYHPYISDSFYQILGLEDEPKALGQGLTHFVSPSDRDRVESEIRQSARDFTSPDLELRLLGKDGREVWVTHRSSIRRLDDGTIIWDGFGTDITQQKRTAEQVFNLTYRDNLTGLDNRLGFESALANAIHGSNQKQTEFALFFIDIADFRAINDTLGAGVGDLIIRETAKRLQIVAGCDATIARIGGDEFAVLKGAIGEAEATTLAAEICARLGEPVQLHAPGKQADHSDEMAHAECKIEVNIGIAGLPEGDAGISGSAYQDAVSEYMKRCDIALYEAKRLGQGRYSLYSRAIDHRIRSRMMLRQSLHSALANHEFILNYQPVLDFRSGEVIAAEALVRWQHPKLGLQPPDQFIPLAEESGLIIPLGNWVLKTAMTQIRHWRRALGIGKISVNVSPIQFSQKDFADIVENLLRETGVAPEMIELELTETTLIDCSAEMLERMHRLRGLGFTLAIDDFGTGYSSLKYLSKLPVDRLKIDQFFVRQMAIDTGDAAIVHAIVTLGKGLNLEVAAEGVETVSQKNILIAEGCLSGQGELFSKPLAAEDFANFVRKTNGLTG